MEKRLHEFIYQILQQCKSGKFSTPEAYLDKKPDLLNMLLLDNQFLTIFNLRKHKFTCVKNIEKVLGYKDDEFTVETLITNIPLKELFFVVEYGTTAYEMMASGKFFEALSHCYWVSFPLCSKRDKNKAIKMVRKCYLYEFLGGIPETQLDIWEAVDHQDSSDYVKWSIRGKNDEETLALSLDFFNRWQKRLGGGFSPRQMEVLLLLEAGKPQVEIAKKFKLREDVVHEHISKAKEKVVNAYQNLLTSKSVIPGLLPKLELPPTFSNLEMIKFARIIGMMPENMLKTYFSAKNTWKNP